MPQDNKERQAGLRARRAMLGMTEVRGIYLPPHDHQRVKQYAKKLAAVALSTPAADLRKRA